MSSIINLKIDVTKLTKDKLFKGEKGTYANLTVAANMDGKEFVFNGGTTTSAPVTSDMDDEDIPF